jgi:hypothetical protein
MKKYIAPFFLIAVIGNVKAAEIYTKIANNGSELPDSAKLSSNPKDWACTKDNKTGLIWEVKTNDGGLRDMNNQYTWYQPNVSENGIFAGYQNGGLCKGSDCDTYAYANTVNQQTLCNAKNWRVPTKEELMTLVLCSDNNYFAGGSCTNRLAITRPTINTNYFPNTFPNWFWSSTRNVGGDYYAWLVSFDDGHDGRSDRSDRVSVRLVRNAQ